MLFLESSRNVSLDILDSEDRSLMLLLASLSSVSSVSSERADMSLIWFALEVQAGELGEPSDGGYVGHLVVLNPEGGEIDESGHRRYVGYAVLGDVNIR